MKKTLKLLMLVSLVSLLFVVPSVRSQTYIDGNLEGSWDDWHYPHFSMNSSSSSGNVTTDFGYYAGNAWVDNSTGFNVNWTISIDALNSIFVPNTKSFYFSFQLISYSTNQTVNSRWVLSQTNGFPLGDSSELFVGLDEVNPFPWYSLNGWGLSGLERAPTQNGAYSIQFMKVDNVTIRVSYGYFNDSPDYLTVDQQIKKVEYYTVGADFFDSSLRLLGKFGHSGTGWFDVEFTNPTLQYDLDPLNGAYEQQGGIFDFFNDVKDGIVSIFSSLWVMMKLFGGMVIKLLPLLPVILIMYGIDAVSASISSRSIKPVGVFFTWVWSMTLEIYGKIVAIAQVIADLIPF